MGRPKQFIDLLGEPALSYTLRAFEEAAGVDGIYVVGDAARVGPLVEEAGISRYAGCAAPGENRPGSAIKGLGMMDEPEDTLVLVHDGSRCLVTRDLIERVVAALEPESDGVIPALPVSDTVKEVREGVVRDTLDRSSLQTVQTPQAFRLGPLRRAYRESGEALERVTDDASLVEMRGGKVRVVEGERTNIKLTSPEDLIFAHAILQARLAEAVRGAAG
jgi:2-C-methyl-D-erythritol 4-phosphate cytidylyltransferase